MIDQAHIDALYDAKFYQENIDNKHQYDALGDAVHAVISHPSFVVELGCGSGLLLKRLWDLGHGVHGCDASNAGLDVCASLGVHSERQDLTQPMRNNWYGDVCICVEVAEHLPAKFADILAENVAAHARQMIIWSAAPPGQGGVDHVNEQPPMYWLDRFKAFGWMADVAKTKALRIVMWEWKAQHCYCRENFYVLVRQRP